MIRKMGLLQKCGMIPQPRAGQHVLFSYSVLWQLWILFIQALPISFFHTFPCLVSTNILLFIPCPRFLNFRTTLTFPICAPISSVLLHFSLSWDGLQYKEGKSYSTSFLPICSKSPTKTSSSKKMLLPYPLWACCLFISTWVDGNGQY